MAASRERTGAEGGVEPEAVLRPNGRLEHAVGPATSAPAREALALAARCIDRARGSLRRRDPSEAVEIWRGLVAGRWSLVDRFDSDGRRFLVAHKNDPSMRDPRGLTERERQVVGYADLGRSNKAIAYELGISPSTVGAILTNARAKLKRITAT
jgi:DNA-binding NarL/FixJ family response regulator